MSEAIEWEIVTDEEPDDAEETITGDEIFAAIIEGARSAEQWRNGVGTLRITQIVDGQCVGPVEMTKAEFDQMQHDLEAQEQHPIIHEANKEAAA
jgi:hypothetical protein